jgi:hypothetical protein
MLPITVIAFLCSLTTTSVALLQPDRSQAWLILMIASIAITCGGGTALWAEPRAAKLSKRNAAKIVFASLAAIIVLPALLIGGALFLFFLLPAEVLILPLIGIWDFGALRVPAARLIPHPHHA